MNKRNMIDWMAIAIALVLLSSATACSRRDIDPVALQWVRGSVEAAALYVQTYRLAALEVARQRGDKASSCASSGEKPWGVVLDVDETVLNNSEWRAELAQRGQQFSKEGWNVWVRTQRATALPGAREFVLGVKELCGNVVFVTSRSEEVCDATRSNLEAQGLPYDSVICAARGKDKQEQFKEIRAGGAASGLPALELLAFVGDNIQDFPAWSQTSCHSPADLERDFGTRYFLLPNPVYGSWENVTRNGAAACTLSQ